MSDQQTIYLVDDDDALRAALAKRLQLAGYRARAFASPLEFLSAVPPNARGCAIFDLRMPEMTGLELMRAMKERRATLPVIFMSGYGDLRSTVEAERLGAVAFLDKPVPGAKLLAAVEEGLARDRAGGTYPRASAGALSMVALCAGNDTRRARVGAGPSR